MILDTVLIGISKENFLTCKITGKTFSDIGNFAKHLKRHGLSIENYSIKFYSKFLPKCLECGQISDFKREGYWNQWYPICCKHNKAIKRNAITTENRIRRIKETDFNNFSDFITFEYWLSKEKSISQATEIIRYLLHGDNCYYKRLVDGFYNSDWTPEAKQIYITSILNECPILLKSRYSFEGLQQRGISAAAAGLILEKYYKDRSTGWRDSTIQKENCQKYYHKYSKKERRKFNVRCIDYWILKGYSIEEATDKVSKIQSVGLIENIRQKYNCTFDEARDIQTDRYARRLKTIRSKPLEIQKLLYSKQDASSMTYCLRKCDFDYKKATNLYYTLLKKRMVPFGRASKESLRYFIPLYKYLRRDMAISHDDIYFGITGSREYYIFDSTNQHFFMYDFTICSKKLIIEYDGKFWHSMLKNKMNDKIKQSLAESQGFKILHVSSTISDTTKLIVMKEFINENI